MIHVASFVLFLVFHFSSHVYPVPIDICYLIDETQNKFAVKHSVDDKLQLARNISRCLLSKRADTRIATVFYDNRSAKLGFNFKSIDDILNDGFQKIGSSLRLRRNIKEARQKQEKSFLRRHTVRVFNDMKVEKSSGGTDSPQTMAFLTAAETVVAAESQSNGRVPNFKVVVISDSDVFPVMNDVKNYFRNASVEISAVDLSEAGSSELKSLVSMPFGEHYFHSPMINLGQQTVVNDVCESLLQVSLQNNDKTFFKVNKLLTRPSKKISSPNLSESPQYQYPAVAAENIFSDLDKYIEGDSSEYRWSPHPEQESSEAVEDTPEELYGSETKKDICKYLRDECKMYMKSGLCTDLSAQAQGMKKFCKTTCGFCV